MKSKFQGTVTALLALAIAGVSSLALWFAIRLAPSAEVAQPQFEVSAPDPAPTAIPQPYPTTPPDASLIAVSDPDLEGYATVTGSPGAVEPLASVVVVNLNARNFMTSTAGADGSFDLGLYAPPGSSLLVKYEPTGGDRIQRFWGDAQGGAAAGGTVENLNPLPGTILHVDRLAAGDEQQQNYHSVGAFFSENPSGWSGWWVSGTLEVPPGGTGPGLQVQQGEVITLSGRMHVTAPELTCSGTATPTVTIADIGLQYLFDAQGRSEPWDIWFGAHLFTPTGIPIEHEGGGQRDRIGQTQNVSAMTCVTEDAFEADWSVAITVPVDYPDGIYRPFAIVFTGDPLPLDPDVPTAVVWYHTPESMLDLPPIRVGDPEPPTIPVTLLGDHPVNGHRGMQAAEDLGHYMLATRVLLPPHQEVIPRLDARSGEPLVYRLEPGAHWLSATERRLPPPPHIALDLPSGELLVQVHKPGGGIDELGPAPFAQASVRTPTTPGGADLHEGTGHIGDLYHMTTMEDAFAYTFDEYGPHTIVVSGQVNDVYGNTYTVRGTYDLMVARVLDLDPAQLPTTPYEQGNAFAPGLHVFPPVPADVTVQLVHMPLSDPDLAITQTVTGQANRFGIFQPPAGTIITLTEPGEFRVDIGAVYTDDDGTVWAGYMTWGNVVASHTPQIVAHGRRGMDYKGDTLDPSNLTWFTNQQLDDMGLLGTENYYPYHSGDIHWGDETEERAIKGDSIHTIITLEDKYPSIDPDFYGILQDHFTRTHNCYRWPPEGCSLSGLISRTEIREAPLFITTKSGIDPAVDPDDIDLFAYWYGSSQRPDVRVREIVSEDGMGTAYWRFNDTYGYQIGEPADGDHPGDIKWEFGGVVFRTITDTDPINEYAIYSSLWALLPHNDPVGARVTPPFQDGIPGVSIDGGPILTMTVEGEEHEIDVLFLPKCVRPGDVLEIDDTIAFCGHVGPPLNSRVDVTITSPSNVQLTAELHASRIGWLYDPGFDVAAWEAGRWTVDVFVAHEENLAYAPAPTDHNTGTVMGTTGRYEFYVVDPGMPRLSVTSPQPGYIVWPETGIQPVHIRGVAPVGTSEVRYTIHDKGVVMGQGGVTPDASGAFTVTYDAVALHESFSMLSLTAHEGLWEGLADEVSINLLAIGSSEPRANTVTLIGEEAFVGGSPAQSVYLPVVLRDW